MFVFSICFRATLRSGPAQLRENESVCGAGKEGALFSFKFLINPFQSVN